jgi:ParB family chromosome partitioning protein
MSDDGNKRLGRGLSALLGEETEDYAALDKLRASKDVPIEMLRPNAYQPRHRFDKGELQSLTDSVRAKGILQPILVRRVADEPNNYEIIAGERRWRAAQAAGLHQVPVFIRDMEDRDALEVALIENLQRQDLTPIEEALGYQRMLDEFTYTQEQLAKEIGKSRSQIANMLRLLGLPEEVKEMLDDGRLSAGHARALITSTDPVSLARQIVAAGFTVRQAEELTKRWKGPSKRKAAPASKDADTLALEGDLSAALGLKVTIHHHGDHGDVRIVYRTLEQLDEVCRRLCHQVDETAPGLDEDMIGPDEPAFDIAASGEAPEPKAPLDVEAAWDALNREESEAAAAAASGPAADDDASAVDGAADTPNGAPNDAPVDDDGNIGDEADEAAAFTNSERNSA